MDFSKATLRIATVQDAPAIQAIYEPYVLNTCITFEIDVPTVADIEARIASTLQHHPYFVAELDGEVIGYTYSSFFRPRRAYRTSMETSIYLRQDVRGGGVGRRLYRALGLVARMQNISASFACIAQTNPPSDLAPATSRTFHEKVGYSLVGTFHRCGFKLGTWVDMAYMEKRLLDQTEAPEAFIPFSELDHDAVVKVLAQV